MKKFIDFGMFSYYSFCPLILPIFCYFNFIFYMSVFQKDYYFKGKLLNFIEKNHILICSIIEGISLILSGILEYISSVRLKSVLISENKKNDTYLIYDYEKKLRSSKTYYILIFISALLNCLFNIIVYPISDYQYSKYLNTNNLSLLLRYIQLISTALLCYFLINFKLSRHHYIGLIWVLIGTTFEYAFNLDKKFFTIPDIIYFISYVLFFLGQVIEKIIIESKFISPFKLLFYKGICLTIINIILYLILTLIPCENNFLKNYYCTSKNVETINIIKIFKDISSLITLILYLIITFFLYLFAILTNYYFNPNYRVISDSFTDVINYFYILTVFGKNYYEWYIIIGNIILIFGILIFNEIIVLNFCDISRNTKYEIYKRGNLEQFLIEWKKKTNN